MTVVGLGWPATAGAVSRETGQSAGLGWPGGAPDVSRETESAAAADDTAEAPARDDDLPIEAAAAEAAARARRDQQPFPLPPAPRVLTVANQKGGVGKTTSTVNIAAALAMHGARVLVVDLDPQGNASTACGVEHHSGVPSIYDVLIGRRSLDEVTAPAPDVPGLFVVPATIDLAGAEIELVTTVAREMRLQRALRASTAHYNYVFIDCPPSLGLLTVNALTAGREVLIPIQCEYYALEGLSQLLSNIELVRSSLNPDLTISTVVLTMYDGRTRLAAQVVDDVRAHFTDRVLRAVIPRNVRISEAPSYGQSVLTFDPGSRGAVAYLDAAREIAERGAADRTASPA